MKKSFTPVVLLLCMCVALLSACSKNEDRNSVDDIFNGSHDPISQENTSNNSYSSGYGWGLRETMKDNTIIYTGEGITLPFRFINHDSRKMEVGLFLIFDGVIQPFSVKKDDQLVMENITMYTVQGGANEDSQFDVIWQPANGNKGETLGLYYMSLFVPSFGPTNDKYVSYGNYHSARYLGATKVRMNTESMGGNQYTVSDTYSVYEITQKMIDDNQSIDGNVHYLDENTVYNISQDNSFSENSKRFASYGSMTLFVRVFGGDAMTYRTAVFVNHQQIKINGKDYVEYTVGKGKVAAFSFPIELNPNERYSTFYTVTTPIGQNYLKENADPHKTLSCLLVNENVAAAPDEIAIK